MHISEGVIIGKEAALYTAAGVSLVGWGVVRMKAFVQQAPENKPLLGMGAALIFFVSLIPIPAFTGTCSHPCGTPLIGILLGPAIGIALAGVSLMLQAAFFAHGGFSTWGANVVALGLCGCTMGWAVFRLARRSGLPIWAAGAAGGLIGDLCVYAASGFILGFSLSHAPDPQYSLGGYLLAIYSAYLPTQLPIGIAEMVVTGLALHYAYRQRPEVLEALGVIARPGRMASKVVVMVMFCLLAAGTVAEAEQSKATDSPVAASQAAPEAASSFSGMDEAVNEHMAENAGRPARSPYIDPESMGDIWNALLLGAGGICGFVVGRYSHLLWGSPRNAKALP